MDLMARYQDNYFDLAIVDPPYGATDAIDLPDNKTKSKQATTRTQYKQFENIAPSLEYFKEVNRVAKNWIIWGGNFFNIKGGVIAWNKNGTAFGEGEVAICSTHNSVRFYEYTWNGMLQGDMKNKEHRIHPTQKPVQLYKWLLQNYAKAGDKILDTHAGSFSIGIACHYEGFELTACELDKEYYDASVKRFREQTKQLKLV